MSKIYLFADEAGCLTFNRNQNTSRYFIICTVSTGDLSVGQALSQLRHDLIWDGIDVREYFHATVESQQIRDRVFAKIREHSFKIQATICEKAKAQSHITKDKARFYKYPWFYHLKHGLAPHIPAGAELLVTAASIGTKKERLTFTDGLSDVMTQTVRGAKWAVDFRPSQTDPCLQLADYCAWAIQRKWERGDTRSYDLIADRITYEYDLWKHGAKYYY